ncbi:MAG: filamentous hemagglutinin N-terminal domain-containing protein, partial [Verrucomicrobia bacterium]|nr:filamentous hemagglutinin N-terminal domain-containing protein [Verrucomicrobiota bacterium]
MKKLSVRIFALVVVLLAAHSARANPLGGAVAGGSGNATINNAGAVTTINQTANRAIIDWNSFNIGSGETTLFRFLGSAGAGSAVLNRVNASGGLSTIYGALRSELGSGQIGGTVYLINPNGIVVGPSGMIQVGNFTASTYDLGSDRLSA